MLRRKWSEVDVMEIDLKPFIDTTYTVEKWREVAKSKNVLVKIKGDSVASIGNGEIEIEIADSATDVPIGILRSVTGDPSTFPKKFMARVAVAAWDCNCDGRDTGALTAALLGNKIKPGPDGEAVIIHSSQTGNGYNSGGVDNCRVIGGTQGNLRLSFDFRDNFRWAGDTN